MALLEDPVFKNKYQKYKYRVKLWESEFIEKLGRKPSKVDIKQADPKIKEAYKVYWNLKTRALEDSLTDITFSEENSQSNDSVLNDSLHCSTFVDNTINNFDETTNDSILNSTALNDSISFSFNELTNSSLCGKSEIENAPDNANIDVKNVSNVWNKSLNLKKNDDLESRRSLVRKSSSFQLSQKMFKSSSFVKRNPRKSLSVSKLPSKAPEKKTEIDEESVTMDEPYESVNEKDISDEFLESAIESNIKIKINENVSSCQSVISGIQQIVGNQKVVHSVDQGWLQRCTNDIKNIKTTVSSSSNHISDDEDFIYDSDEERPKKRVRNFRKHCSQGDLPESKKMRFDNFSKHQSEPITEAAVGPTFFSILKTNSISTNNFNTDKNINSQKIVNEVKSVDNDDFKIVTTQKAVKKDSVLESKNNDNEIIENLTKEEKTKENEEIQPPKSRRVDRKKIMSDDENEDENWQNNDEDSDNSLKRKRKVTKKEVNKKEKVPRKPKATATRKSSRLTRNKETKAESETEEINNKSREISANSYDIENVNAVARFSLNPSSTGSLIEDFSRVLHCKENENSSQKVGEKDDSNVSEKEKRLQKKIANGTINDNFVRINLKKKVYVRGKKNFNYSKYKKNLWKQRKKELATSEANMDMLDYIDKKGSGANYCFKCKEEGHFSKYCPNVKTDKLLPLEESEDIEIPSQFPTLEEAAQMAQKSSVANFSNMAPRNSRTNQHSDEELEEWEEWEEENDQESQPVKEICKVPEELIEKLLPPEKNTISPLYSPASGYFMIDTPSEVFETLKKFGYDSFRQGQEKAIMRILSGVSTLVTLATGTGKSLCYQLPAYMFAQRYQCITLVVSPLVSLMDDQVKGVCPILRAACLHTNQTEKVRNDVVDSVRKGNIDVLLVSPEAIVAGEKSTGFGAILRDLPPIAFACIDEAHCISQWSHNFRPSYLMLCRVLREKLKVKVLLGLTATATKANAMNIVEHLGIPDGIEGVVTDRPLPDNLQLTVSRDDNRDQALVKLLNSPRLEDCDSILIYCTRREECVRVAGYLRTVLQNSIHAAQKTKKKLSPIAEAYHAGFSAYQRKAVQKAFMNGDTRIIVATIAFGMGINKSDIRCVIHYNMPSNFENYVQEIGRAGRDGLPAQCHLFLSSKEEDDKMELRRHIYANAVERHTIRKLLNKLFVPCSCLSLIQKQCGQRCGGHEVALPVNDIVEYLDTNEEIISTLLCYLELHPKNYITVLSSAYVMAKVSTYGGYRPLRLAAQSSPPLAMAVALGLKNGTYSESDSMIEFNVIEIASNIGWDSGIVKSHLKELEWITVNGVTKRSQLTINFHTLGIRVRAPGDLSEAELDDAFNALYQRSKSQEITRVAQLNSICDIVRKYSVPTVLDCSTITDKIIKTSELFKEEIRNYFVEDDQNLDSPKEEKITANKESQIIQDIRGLVNSYRDTNFTGRTVARIFYGIQSPNYPARMWTKSRYWRAHLDVDFNLLCQLATQEIFATR